MESNIPRRMTKGGVKNREARWRREAQLAKMQDVRNSFLRQQLVSRVDSFLGSMNAVGSAVETVKPKYRRPMPIDRRPGQARKPRISQELN